MLCSVGHWTCDYGTVGADGSTGPWQTQSVFFKWDNPSLFYVYFCLFHLTQININWKTRRWCAWNSNPGWQTCALSYAGPHLFYSTGLSWCMERFKTLWRNKFFSLLYPSSFRTDLEERNKEWNGRRCRLRRRQHWQCDQKKLPNVYKSCPKWFH